MGRQRSKHRRGHPLSRPDNSKERKSEAEAKMDEADDPTCREKLLGRFRKAGGAIKRAVRGWSKSRKDKRKKQRHDAEQDAKDRADDNDKIKAVAAEYRRFHMDRLAQKIRSSPVDLLLHSASEIDDELHDDAKTEIKAQFTENQINKVEMQAQLVHYYFYLLGKKHFSVVANGATAAELADEAVEGSPYRYAPNVSGGV